MRQLRRFLQLPATQRAFLVTTATLLWAVRLGLWVLPFQTLRHLLAWIAQAPGSLHKANPSSVDRVIWGVIVASRYLPKATCLTQALAAHVLLQREGHPAQLHIGVARGDTREFQAHAWLEREGKVVIGESDVERYTPLMAVEREGR